MSTNYYALAGCSNPCRHCEERLHLAKRTGGTAEFGYLTIYTGNRSWMPDREIAGWDDWVAFHADGGFSDVVDEYGRVMTFNEFIRENPDVVNAELNNYDYC